MKNRPSLRESTGLAAIAAIVLGTAVTASADSVSVKGSDTMVILGQKWAEVYMKQHPGTTVQVTGGGTGTGIAALLNGTTDICNASRPMKPAETADFVKKFRGRPHDYKMCMDGLSVYVHRDNPVRTLSLPQLEAIFTGAITGWKELGGPDAPISLYGRENSSGTYEFFKEHVLRKRDFAAATKTMPGTAAVIQGVARDPLGIGYGGIAYGEGVRIVPVSATDGGEPVEPTEANVISGKYPIARFLFNYVAPASDKATVAAYIAWCRGAEGQQLVREIGYFALPADVR